MLKVRTVSPSRLQEILESLNSGVEVRILPSRHSTFVYVGVSIYKVNVLGPFIEGLLNKLEVPFKYFNKFID